MKKSLKLLILAALMLVMVIALTGCGSKLIATKDIDEGEASYEEKVEFTFKKDKVSAIKMTMTFDSKEEVDEYVKEYNDMLEVLKTYSDEEVKFPELTSKGKSIIMEMDVEEFVEMYGGDIEEVQNTSKKELKSELEKDGYKVK